MVEKIPLYVIGLKNDEPYGEYLMSKIGSVLEKAQKKIPNIIEAKVSAESQNTEGTRTNYDVTVNINTSKHHLIFTESGWDIFKITDELCRKIERELFQDDNKRQRDSIRKKGEF
ncbi:HPF/RaiA family ribosome-associated protein [Nitrosopumilus sp. S4]